MSTRWLLARMHNGDQDCQASSYGTYEPGLIFHVSKNKALSLMPSPDADTGVWDRRAHRVEPSYRSVRGAEGHLPVRRLASPDGAQDFLAPKLRVRRR